MSEQSPQKIRGLWRIFALPLCVGLISGVGLIAALLTRGIADFLWSLAIAVPLLTIGWYVYRSRLQTAR